jgi:hypothetical protein
MHGAKSIEFQEKIGKSTILFRGFNKTLLISDKQRQKTIADI